MNRLIHIIAILIIISTYFKSSELNAQLLERMDIEYVIGDNTLNLSQIGGLDNPMFYDIDVNNDGLNDLFIYDPSTKSSFVLETELNNGVYTRVLNSDIVDDFPKLGEWAIVIDYNMDNIPDIITNHNNVEGQVKVYSGRIALGKLSFTEYENNEGENVLYFDNLDGETQQLFISKYELPAIHDVDKDGDLDILSYGNNTGKSTLYKNFSVEFNGDASEFNLIAVDDCWGGFFEEGLDTVKLASTYGECANTGKQVTTQNSKMITDKTAKHGGASYLILDADLDGDDDLILGDRFRSTSLALLINEPVDGNTFYQSQMPFFPAYDEPINVKYFPMSFAIDADFDGIKDIIAGSFAIQTGNMENRNVANLYKGKSNGEFEFIESNFLVKDMLDVGSHSKPVFVDYNVDGLTDLVIGNYGYYSSESPSNTRLFLYENIGTATEARFELVDEDWLGFSEYSSSFNYTSPAFGDLDGDEDLDVLLGVSNGSLIYGENVAGAGNPIDIHEFKFNFMFISESSNSTPAIYDINNDGLNDILVGNYNGVISYYENLSENDELYFDNQNPVTPFGEVDVIADGSFSGFSDFCLFNYSDTTYLLIGSESGSLKLYNNIKENETANLISEFVGVDFGTFVSPTVTNLNVNNNLEVILGNRRGGIQNFNLNLSPDTLTSNHAPHLVDFGVSCYPNPTNGKFFIKNDKFGPKKCLIINSFGEIVDNFNISKALEIDISYFKSGIYFLYTEDMYMDDKNILKIIKQ